MMELRELNTSEEFKITQYAGEVLLGLYAIASILVAINMLIAMMSNTYQRVAVSSKNFNRRISFVMSSFVISRRSLFSGPRALASTTSMTARTPSANLTSRFCYHSLIIPVVWLEKCLLYCNEIVLSDLEMERENENSSPSVHVAHKTAKQIISHRGKNESGSRIYENKKHACIVC